MSRRLRVALGLLAVCGPSACNDSPAPPPPSIPAPTVSAPQPSSLATVAPILWQKRVPATPGVVVLGAVYGPRLNGQQVVISSTAIGTAALDLATGALLSQSPELLPNAAGELGKEPEAGVSWRVVVAGDVVEVTDSLVRRVGVWDSAIDELDVGAARPLLLGGQLVVAFDEQLAAYAWADGIQLWRSDDGQRYAYVDEGLHAGGGGQLLALALDDGVGLVKVGAATGRRVARGPRFGHRRVLAASWSEQGSVVVATRTAVPTVDELLALAPDGSLRWRWSLPRADQPRLDPIGLALGEGQVVVFYDGRFVAALQAP